jgi:hypothetical protein
MRLEEERKMKGGCERRLNHRERGYEERGVNTARADGGGPDLKTRAMNGSGNRGRGEGKLCQGGQGYANEWTVYLG